MITMKRSVQRRNNNRNEIEGMLPVVSLVGELNVYQELGGHRIDIPIEMTPLVNFLIRQLCTSILARNMLLMTTIED